MSEYDPTRWEIEDKLFRLYAKDYVDAKNARIAELEAQLSQPRQVGGYYIVPKEDYDEMKFRMEDLEDSIAKDKATSNLVCDYKVLSSGRLFKIGFSSLLTGEHVQPIDGSIVSHPTITIDGGSPIGLTLIMGPPSYSNLLYEFSGGATVPQDATVLITMRGSWIQTAVGFAPAVTDALVDNQSGKPIYGCNAEVVKPANVKEKRLACEDGKYDKCGVDGMTVDCAEKTAMLAQRCLDNGQSISFAAACCIVLNREIEDVKRKNSILVERNGNLANGIKNLSKLTIAN